MIVIHLVGDGPRDEATVPPLVASILDCRVELAPIKRERESEHSRYWTNIHIRSGGYARKLELAIRIAIDSKASGLVAVVDRDKESSGDRRKKLMEGRERHRSKNARFQPRWGRPIHTLKPGSLTTRRGYEGHWDFLERSMSSTS